VAAAVQATDLKDSWFTSRTLVLLSIIIGIPFRLHCLFETSESLEQFGETVVVKITWQAWVKVAESDNAVALIDFSFERRQKAHLPHAQLFEPFLSSQLLARRFR
jgi:hypothetical protein